MLKKQLTADEKFGLSDDEVGLAQRYLRKYRTKSALSDMDSIPLLELYLIGTSFVDIQRQYPQYPLSQILLTAALKKWGLHRHKMMGSLKERVQAKVVKSVVESVDFLTTMLHVASIEHLEEMKAYVQDPKASKKPQLRIKSMKDFKDVLESLTKLMATATPDTKNGKMPSMLSAMEPARKAIEGSITGYKPREPKEPNAAVLLAEIVDEDDDEE